MRHADQKQQHQRQTQLDVDDAATARATPDWFEHNGPFEAGPDIGAGRTEVDRGPTGEESPWTF